MTLEEFTTVAKEYGACCVHKRGAFLDAYFPEKKDADTFHTRCHITAGSIVPELLRLDGWTVRLTV